MNEKNLSSAERLIPPNYLHQALQAKSALQSDINILIEKRQCPEDGWSESSIEYLLNELSQMDSNNFAHNAGVGEREARIFSGIVSRRHYQFGHGIGRSGDLTEVQPKAAGSSILYKLANSLILHLIRISGIRSTKACLLVPMATGMSIVLCFLTIKKQRPKAKYVIWPRIDQKSCFKAISSAGLEAKVIENIIDGDELRTDLDQIEQCINELGPDAIAAVYTTTSCFAPRGIDKIEEVSKLCKAFDIPHIINNAYGLQSSKCCHIIEQAARIGRIDAFIQSTDKNFMVPVGGAVIASFSEDFIQNVSKSYPGRASIAPIMDVFITALQMGVNGYKALLQQRKEMKVYLEEKLQRVAQANHLKVLVTKNNPISIALTLPPHHSITQLGSMLFLRGVSGTRVLVGEEEKEIAGHVFKGWGRHCDSYPHPYLTAAASIGMAKEDVDLFISKLEKALTKFKSGEPHSA